MLKKISEKLNEKTSEKIIEMIIEKMYNGFVAVLGYEGSFVNG